MEVGMIAVRYAKALFELAQEKGILEQVLDDMSGIADVFKESPELSEFLENPVTKEEQKKEFIDKVFQSRIQPITYSFINLLIEKNREKYLLVICLLFQKMYKEKEGYKEVVLTTAVPVSENFTKILQEKLEKSFHSKLSINMVVDEKLIGGFKLRVDDMLMDKSIFTQLANMRKQLLSK